MEAKNSTLLSSCDRYLLEPIEWPKRSEASCGDVSGTRDCSLGPEGKKSLISRTRGNLVVFLELLHDMWDILRVMMGNSGSLSCDLREV